jgi:hypothetical protein
MQAHAGGDRQVQASQATVWLPRGSPVPTELAAALERRAVRFVPVDSSPDAVAAICLASRSRPPGARTPVIVVDPPRVDRLPEAADILADRVAHIAWWVYDSVTGLLRAAPLDEIAPAPVVKVESGILARVGAAGAGGRGTPPGEPEQSGAGAGSVPPVRGQLRLVGDPRMGPVPPHADHPVTPGSPPDAPGRAVLTSEELGMLLGAEPNQTPDDRGAYQS